MLISCIVAMTYERVQTIPTLLAGNLTYLKLSSQRLGGGDLPSRERGPALGTGRGVDAKQPDILCMGRSGWLRFVLTLPSPKFLFLPLDIIDKGGDGGEKEMPESVGKEEDGGLSGAGGGRRGG